MKIGKFLILILSLTFITDLVIFLNFPVYRQILSILTFTFVPGILIYEILRINRIDKLETFLIIFGLGIAFLMIFGLLVNEIFLFLGIPKPLSSLSLVFTISAAILILSLILFLKERKNFNLDFKKYYENYVVIPKPLTLFSFILPFLAFLGTYLMNVEQNNAVLIILFIIISIYIIFFIKLQNNLSTYVFSLYNISLAVLLTVGLTSNYLNGRDINTEFYAFRLVSENLYWSITNSSIQSLNIISACVSVTLLPTIYWSISGIDQIYVYKVCYPLLLTFIPLTCFSLYRKYIGNQYAFFAALFLAFQAAFYFDLQSAMRTGISLLFFSLALLVFFEDDISGYQKPILFLVFVFCLILSHYSVSYLLLILLAFLLIISLFLKRHEILKLSKQGYNLTLTTIILIFSIIFVWYGQTTGFSNFVGFLVETTINLGNFFAEDVRAKGAYVASAAMTTPDIIYMWFLWLSFIVIAIGTFNLLFKSIKNNTKIKTEYILLMTISGSILFLFLLLPYVSTAYGNTRVYAQYLIILALAIPLGIEFIAKQITKITKININVNVILALFIIMQLFCGTFLVHQIFEDHYSDVLNRDGDMYQNYFIHDSEVYSAQWLNNNVNNQLIYGDRLSFTRLLMGLNYENIQKINTNFFLSNKTISGGFVYLRSENVINQQIRIGRSFSDMNNLSDYSHLFANRNQIYNDGGSQIWL